MRFSTRQLFGWTTSTALLLFGAMELASVIGWQMAITAVALALSISRILKDISERSNSTPHVWTPEQVD